jgi:integrase
MGTVYRKKVTRPLPKSARVITRDGKRCAEWRDRRGQLRRAPIIEGKNGRARIRVESSTYIAKFRDGAGCVVEEATGCRSKDAAQMILRDLMARAEKVRSGALTPSEDAALDWQHVPIREPIEAYCEHLEAEGRTARHMGERNRQLSRVFGDCSIATLGDLDRVVVERWLLARSREGMGAVTRNSYRTAVSAFCNWCVEAKRLTSNPLAGLPRANENVDRRHPRRALTEDEIGRLLDAAQRRPLHDRMCKNRGEGRAALTDETRTNLIRVGRERALIYKTLLLTGLRRGELASITVGNVRFQEGDPYLELPAQYEKRREGARIPLRGDLAKEVGEWLDEKLDALRADSRCCENPIPARLPAETPLFDMPRALVKVLNRDLAFAGIPKRDDRGKAIDVHALRHTFCTHLNKAGVPMRVAQAAMRHSDPKLTANTYTDPVLLDVTGALDALPEMPLDKPPRRREHAVTAERPSRTVAPNVAPTPGITRHFETFPDTNIEKTGVGEDDTAIGEMAFIDRALPHAARGYDEEENGGRCRTRTCDPLRVKQVL